MFMFCSDMNSRPFPPGPDPDADVAAERRRLLLVRQLERLDQMIAAGMDMVQALAAQAAGSGPKVIEGDLILAYSRASRAVRMAILLQSHLIAEPDARPEAALDAELEPEGSPDEPAAQDLAEREPIEFAERREAERGERLERDDIYRAVLTRPAGELVVEICRDLGLDPDWPDLPPEPGAEDVIVGDYVGASFAPCRPRSPPRAASP